MNDEPLHEIEQIERRLGELPLPMAPAELRTAVLADVHRELRAARWDRRLARAAVVLLVVGFGLNAAIGLHSRPGANRERVHLAGRHAQPSLAETAALVAEATDAETGRRFARHLVALRGRELTADETAAIDLAVERPLADAENGKDG